MSIRPFDEREYSGLAAVGTAIDPQRPRDAAWYLRRDASRDPNLRQQRLVAERDGLVVGWGEVGHMWWAYHPSKFVLHLNVAPAYQHQGIGSRLYARLLDTLSTWNPTHLRCETRETRPDAAAFLTHHGFTEVHRRWESRLTLSQATVDRRSALDERLTRLGIAIATFAEERARRGQRLVRDVYELEMRATRDEPGFDPDTAPMPFAQFLANELGSDALDDGSFLAFDGEQVVGVSRLSLDPLVPRRLQVGFTGVDPAYRGRGIATALKLRTIDYGRANGFDEIRTQNDATNSPMLHINAVLGFEREPAWLVYEKVFA